MNDWAMKTTAEVATTDWPVFWVQIAVGAVTLILAGVSVVAALSAAKTSKKANDLSGKSAEAMEKSVDVARRMLELEADRSGAIAAKEQREQASRIWVSMIVVRETDAAGRVGDAHGVLQIRNGSDRPVRNMRIESRGWISSKRIWFPKEICEVSVVFPGDTVIRSRTSTTDWDIPTTYFPHFSGTYHHAIGPKGDPYYVLSVQFDDAEGNAWRLENGHCLVDGSSA